LFQKIKNYFKEWLNSPDTLLMNIPFDAYLYENKRLKIIRVLGKRMRRLILDYLAVPPDESCENEDDYVIRAISRWYFIRIYKPKRIKIYKTKRKSKRKQ
jgi:hypothetical protein